LQLLCALLATGRLTVTALSCCLLGRCRYGEECKCQCNEVNKSSRGLVHENFLIRILALKTGVGCFDTGHDGLRIRSKYEENEEMTARQLSQAPRWCRIMINRRVQ
jgi:hypothetical protein